MIDAVYITVQGLINKDQLGYLKPLYYNRFADIALRKEYNSLFSYLKTSVRKQNWHLDGLNFANVAEHIQQLLEYYSDNAPITGSGDGSTFYEFALPSDLEYVEDIYIKNNNTPIAKISYKKFKLIQRNHYVSPSICSPVCAKIGNNIVVSPKEISEIDLHYLRKPKTPKWTFIEDAQGKPLFDPTANDFQDFDIPETSKDNLTSYIAEMAGVTTQNQLVIQTENQAQAQDAQIETRD